MAGIKIPSANTMIWGIAFALIAIFVVNKVPQIKRIVG